MSCIFCQIADGKLPSDILYQDEEVLVFPDIQPQAPLHLLIIPKKHIPSISRITREDKPLVGHMINTAQEMARREGVSEKGYRLVINCGQQGGQLVPHLHLHLLGGRRLSDQLG